MHADHVGCDVMQTCGFILLLLLRRQVSSIGYIGGDKNISITQQLSAVVEKHLGIPPARVYVNVRQAFASCICVNMRLVHRRSNRHEHQPPVRFCLIRVDLAILQVSTWLNPTRPVHWAS
jgi:Macrophage migration inhibitory factor (MIF)